MRNGYWNTNYWGSTYWPGLFWPVYGEVAVSFKENIYFGSLLTTGLNLKTDITIEDDMGTNLTASLNFGTEL